MPHTAPVQHHNKDDNGDVKQLHWPSVLMVGTCAARESAWWSVTTVLGGRRRGAELMVDLDGACSRTQERAVPGHVVTAGAASRITPPTPRAEPASSPPRRRRYGAHHACSTTHTRRYIYRRRRVTFFFFVVTGRRRHDVSSLVITWCREMRSCALACVLLSLTEEGAARYLGTLASRTATAARRAGEHRDKQQGLSDPQWLGDSVDLLRRHRLATGVLVTAFPAWPAGARLVAEGTVDCGLRQLRELAWSDASVLPGAFLERLLASRGEVELAATPWRQAERDGSSLLRNLTYRAPVRGGGLFAPSSTRCVVLQRWTQLGAADAVLHSSQTMLDIPFKDHFRVETRWELRGRGGRTAVRVAVAVPFSKGTALRGQIEGRTRRESAQAARDWLAAAVHATGGAAPPVPPPPLFLGALGALG